MKRLLPFLAWFAASAVAQVVPPAAQPVEEPVVPAPAPAVEAPPAGELKPRTESSSRQFVVHGSDFVMRAAIASLAEETRASLLKVVGEEKLWEHAIAIQLHGNQGDEAPARTMRSQFFQVPGGFRLQLDIHLARGKPAGLESALLELLLIERGLRGKGNARLEASLSIPPWLVEGMLESFRWKRGERDRGLYAALIENNQLFPVKKLLEIADPGEMDAMTRSAFQASSCALVLALLNQTAGKSAMSAMLQEMATFEGDEMALLMKHFPGMNLGKESFSKWWALQLTRMSEPSLMQVLNIGDTEQQLKSLLVVRFKDPAGNDIELAADDFRNLLALPVEARKDAIRPVIERGGLFLYRAFPAHRPILTEYLRILGEIAIDTDDSVEERLQSLATRRADLEALGTRTRDYLEWYRITNSKQLSGDFESFIELKENLQSRPQQRKGPVSEYLDGMQRIFEDD
ncbi:MAG: hypothetical protein VCA73_18360 [Roseibacillus sp.]